MQYYFWQYSEVFRKVQIAHLGWEECSSEGRVLYGHAQGPKFNDHTYNRTWQSEPEISAAQKKRQNNQKFKDQGNPQLHNELEANLSPGDHMGKMVIIIIII